ncbi:MAG: hypothetical protein NVV59_02575 [Chitinophagaceae bacterium]|nr:hypothetical protein [Chitinophagaceae bacterium]
MTLNRLVEVNNTLTVVTYVGVLGLVLTDYPFWAEGLLGLLAALALATNLMLWQKRPRKSKSSRSKRISTWKLALNAALCLAILLTVYFMLYGNLNF